MGTVALRLKDYRQTVAVEQGHLGAAAKIALEKVYTRLFERINQKQKEIDFVGEFSGITVTISMEFIGLAPVISMAAYSDFVLGKHFKLFAYANAVQPKQRWWFERMLHHEDPSRNVEAVIHELTTANNINADILQPYWERLMELYNQGCLDLF